MNSVSSFRVVVGAFSNAGLISEIVYLVHYHLLGLFARSNLSTESKRRPSIPAIFASIAEILSLKILRPLKAVGTVPLLKDLV